MPQITPDIVMQKVAHGKPFIFMLLIAGKPMEEEEAVANQLQMQHLVHLFSLEEQGRASVFGPVANDARIRGLIIFNTMNKDDIAAWMKEDPYIKDGYLTYELYDFFTIPGQQIASY